MVNTMNNLNYNTYGIHSWYKNGYSRGKIYNLLQFKNTAFFEDMPSLSMYTTSSYPSDASTYSYWYDIMTNKPDGENNFSFVLTMQNHLPYNFYREDVLIILIMQILIQMFLNWMYIYNMQMRQIVL